MLNQKTKAKKKLDPFQNLQKNRQGFHSRGHSAHGTLQNLAKTSKLVFSKFRKFSHPKDSHTKFTLATRKLKRMRAFTKYTIVIWGVDVAYVDELANDNKAIKSLLVRHDVFDKTIQVRVWKQRTLTRHLQTFCN